MVTVNQDRGIAMYGPQLHSLVRIWSLLALKKQDADSHNPSIKTLVHKSIDYITLGLHLFLTCTVYQPL